MSAARYLTAALILASAASAIAASPAVIDAMRFSDDQRRSRAVLDLSASAPTWRLTTADGGRRHELRFAAGFKLGANLSLKKLRPRGQVRAVEMNKIKGERVLIFNTAQRASVSSFALDPGGRRGHRLVLDFRVDAKPDAALSVDEVRGLRDVLIAIDAGHGGRDPGAIGADGSHEKDVVLAIARELARQINAERGLAAMLVREKDRYMNFFERREKARRAKADLLISVHADAFVKRHVRGASIYALSRVGARHAISEHLLGVDHPRERPSKLLGEVSLEDLAEENRHLPGTVLDLSINAALESALRIAETILKHLKRVTRLHKAEVEQAGFAVLKPTDVPSLLLETGFLSNIQDARLLGDPAHRAKLATAVVKGLREYYSERPPPGTLLASDRAAPRARLHVVRRGETLSHIAQRYGVGVDELRRRNALKSDILRVGQTLSIPR